MVSSNGNKALYAGVLAAIGASVCCVGPLVLLLGLLAVPTLAPLFL